ncbi:SprT-like domain-containing protein [Halocatena marina]|uniref:SprT-like domain-containing protein n=1 Tax=Halocatena marina TaxID=2934937 RepID=A0ABD5YWK9_9EURY|nr:SprT-like domain-containing protein [Halocatena marina]
MPLITEDMKQRLLNKTAEPESEPELEQVPALDDMTERELLAKSKEYAAETIEEYDMPISMGDFELKISNRMSRSHGNCRKRGNDITINLSSKAYQNHGWENTQHVIRHELIHAVQAVVHDEMSHGRTFKKWSGKMDVDIRADDPAGDAKYYVVCPNCLRSWPRHRMCKLVKEADNRTCQCGQSGLEVRDEPPE